MILGGGGVGGGEGGGEKRGLVVWFLIIYVFF